jgi:hypothetical protein
MFSRGCGFGVRSSPLTAKPLDATAQASRRRRLLRRRFARYHWGSRHPSGGSNGAQLHGSYSAAA